ncbi:MAG: ATP-binding cassette domain-containing protein [Actinomycetota bacterium]|nr:ATP-binding cassette domain-containing protein [Actinomycetota bacterium]
MNLSPVPGTPAVARAGVTRSFGPVRAVEDLGLMIAEGETVALLGPNGAAKTTAISLLLGMLIPDHGTVELFGGPPHGAVAAGLVGAMLHDGGLMAGVTVAELLDMLARLYPHPLPVATGSDRGPTGRLREPAHRRLSGGQAQQTALRDSPGRQPRSAGH